MISLPSNFSALPGPYSKSPVYTFGLPVLFVGALVLFLVHIGASFSHLKMPVTSDFGNASAPYSDALDPWLKGALSYYLGDAPPPNLYRPTVGLFFSSIISAFQSIRAIPLTFIAVFLTSFIGLFIIGGTRVRIILSAALCALVLSYDHGVALLNPECLTVDFWAMSFSVVGLCLIGLSLDKTERQWLPAAAGFALLGLVAAVRGPQLLGGFLVLLWCISSWFRGRQWTTLAVSILTFLAPSIIDSSIRSSYHISENAVVTLYCVYVDPSHGWTPATHQRYYKESPPDRVVVAGYLNFMRSADGQEFMRWALNFAPSHTRAQIARPAVAILLVSCAVLSWLERRRSQKKAAGNSIQPELGMAGSLTWFLRGCWFCILILTWKIGSGGSAGFFHPVLLLGGMVAIIGMLTRRPLAACFALCYIGSVALHAALGVPGSYRVSATYEIYLLTAFICLMVEHREAVSNAPSQRSLAVMSVVALLGIGLAYGGNFLAYRTQKNDLQDRLSLPNHVVKISSDQNLNRSLYLDRQLIYFYTDYDPLPFGTVRSYSAMKSPGGLYHGSFLKPCVVTWEAELPR